MLRSCAASSFLDERFVLSRERFDAASNAGVVLLPMGASPSWQCRLAHEKAYPLHQGWHGEQGP
jgi:hypothetical protein